MAMTHILLTGFAPFGGESINPSWQAVQQLDGWQPQPFNQVKVLELPCAFDDSLLVLQQALDKLKPTVVIAVGQAGGRSQFCLEKVAINYNDARIPDNNQQQPLGTATIEHGPSAYFSTLPLKTLVQALHQQGIPAALSFSAGTFVCNHVFYGLMHQLKDQPHVKAGFIHIPYSPAQACRHGAVASMELATVVQALKVCVELSLATQVDLALVGGTLD
jgi:pyroglutamyl-peptidase